MSLSSCAESALGQLGVETLKALSALCSAANVALNLLSIEKQALVIALNIQNAPQLLKKAALGAVVSQVRQAAQIVPPTILQLCPDLAQVNVMLENAIAGPLEAQINASVEITNNLSISAQVSSELDDINVSIQFFTDLVSSITNVLNSQIPIVP